MFSCARIQGVVVVVVVFAFSVHSGVTEVR